MGTISERNELGRGTFKARFRELLLAAPTRDFDSGWELARTLGRPAVPLLWEMFEAEKANVDKRLVLLIAAVLAGGPGEDERLFELLDQRQPMMQERTMAAFLIALGPRRTRAVPQVYSRILGPNPKPELLLEIAARLATVRFPGGADGVAPVFSDNPGLLAASAFAGMPIARGYAERQWRSTDPHASLFRRGALLGQTWRLALEGRKPQDLDEARVSLQVRAVEEQPLREAAVLLLARAGELDPQQPLPDWDLLRLAAGQPGNTTAMRKWLKPRRQPRDHQPARLAVAFALHQPERVVLEQVPVWAAEPAMRSDLALAYAMRLLGHAPAAQPIGLSLPEVPEWRFVVWASGGAFGAPPTFDDPHLDQLAKLIAAGRATRPVVRDALEELLWQRGSHPALGAWRAERELVRDLLLGGSNRGGGEYFASIPEEDRYFPTGLDRDDWFFTIAVQLYEFTSRPVGAVPAPHRLP